MTALPDTPLPAAGMTDPADDTPTRAARLWRRRLAWGVVACIGTVLLLGAVLLFVLLKTLTPAPGEWSRTMRFGPIERAVSMPAAIRLATHPLGRRWLDGRSLATRIGTLRWQLAPDGETLTATCAPCTLRLPELSREALQWPRAEFSVKRWSQNDFRGTVVIGQGSDTIEGRWQARLGSDGLQMQFAMAQAPIARYYRLFERGVPELARARIDGRMKFDLTAQLPQGDLQVRPVVEGFSVEGLGTEALLDAAPPVRCEAPARAGGFGRWLPMAVVAAEDQRFAEHPGYDLVELEAAWRHNQAQDEPQRGGSTLTQQLAKILYTGDDRTHVRKLRELLYAVEMERTLGKARILDLYLSVVPWGQGECGAHAAARRWAGKKASALTPVEAAWLASLLRNPDAALQAWQDRGEIDTRRVATVLSGLRPTQPSWRRAQIASLKQWTPPAYVGEPVAATPTAVRGGPSAVAAGASQARTK